jgi:hypothetical protein
MGFTGGVAASFKGLRRGEISQYTHPRTNRVIRVWVDSGGGRHYVADDGI